MASILLPQTGVSPEIWNESNISKPWSQFIDYIIPPRMPTDEGPVLKSTPRWTAVLQPMPTLAPRFARLEPSIPDRLLGALSGLLASPGAFSLTGAPLWTSEIPDNVATDLDYLPTRIGMAGRGYSGKDVTTDIRVAIASAAIISARDLAHTLYMIRETVTITSSHQPICGAITGLWCVATAWFWSDKIIIMRSYATCLTYNLALFYNLPLLMRVCLLSFSGFAFTFVCHSRI